MVTCKLDKEVSGEVLGYPLPSWQALLLHRVLPSCGGLLIYLIVICYDIALIVEHYNNGASGVGAFCIGLMVQPALIALVFTLASPPPELETDVSACSIKIKKKEFKWIILQMVSCIFFPIAAIGRYCHQIFWWVEAVYASRASDEERMQDALHRARQPSPMELYLFLQAFVHSAPHAVVNIVNLMSRPTETAFDLYTVQAISIVASMLRMASTATTYRRFEREKLSGRKYPWNYKQNADDDDTESKEKQAQKILKERVSEPIMKKPSVSSQKSYETPAPIPTNSDMIEFSPVNRESPWFTDDSDRDSGTSSDYLHPTSLSPDQRSNSDDEYIRPVSIIDKVAPRRRDTHFTIERVMITPPPAIPAPRPMSLAVWAEKFVENAESIPTWLSAPPRYKYHDTDRIILTEPDIPYRVPRSFVRGLEPQDVTAALVQYLGWYAFFLSRLFSIAAFINCVPVIATIFLFSHYQITLLLLIVPQASTVRRGFYVFLAFIYLFCLMEFKIRFRHVRVWHAFWIIVCTVETLVFTSVWYGYRNNLDQWWKNYITQVIFVSMFLSLICFLVYFILLKPRETIVYINKRNTATSVSKQELNA